MTDWHSHVLPCIDDGSRSIDESLSLLSMLAAQGVDRVVATPHFNALYDEPNEFLATREHSYAKLCEHIGDASLPEVILGAEIAYFPGISNVSELSALTVSGTRLVLLEMPLERWGKYTVDEVLRIIRSDRVKVILAHAERYLPFRNKAALRTFREAGALLQVNASFFINPRTRRRALKMLRLREIHLIGSDCHNIDRRPPRIAEAMDIIAKKLGNNFELHNLKSTNRGEMRSASITER